MDGFGKITDSYVQELKKSKTFQRYKDKYNALKKDEELLNKTKEYQKKRYELQRNSNADELYDKSDSLEREYAFLYENPVSRDYLYAEVAVCRMVQEICLKITQVVDIE